MSKINDKAIDKAYEYAIYAVIERSINALITYSTQLLIQKKKKKEYGNLTGNTIASLSFGVYLDNKLDSIYHYTSVGAIRVKIAKGETVRNFIDYDGNLRSCFQGDIANDGGYGVDTVERFFSSHRPNKQNSIVIATGTEYSEFLENELKLNVLTETELLANATAFQSVKNLISKQ